MSQERLHFLLERWFDGALSAADHAEMESLLSGSKEARAAFWEEAEWQALFRDWGAQEAPRAEAQRPQRASASSAARRRSRPRSTPARSSTRGWAWTVILLVLCAALVAWQWRRPAPAPATDLATVEATFNAAVLPGTKLKPGSWTLTGGVAQLRLAGGATLVVQGPAQLDMVRANEITLRRGRVLAEAPGGLIVGTPQGPARDLGTRFGVLVPNDTEAEAHVFEGRVEMSGQQLLAGQALSVTSGNATRIPADASLFPQPQQTLPAGITDGDFELNLPAARGIPTRSGKWSGDRSEMVSSFSGVQPQSGAGMVRFLDNPPGFTDDAAELWQFVDLSPWRSELARGGYARLAASFNRVASPGDKRTFVLVLAAYRGTIEEIRSTDWRQRPAMTLDYAHKSVSADDDPSTWQQSEAQITVPPGADWLLVNIGANRGSPPRELPGHFADSVSLQITVPPQPAASAR
jgi:hypothetical protein